MVRHVLAISLAGLSLAPLANQLRAHHSFAAFDQTKRVTWEGVITEVEWKNPHSWIHVDVTDASGKTVNWAFESTSPVQLVQRVKRSLLKPGVRISVTGAPGRDASQHIGTFEQFTLD